MRDPISKKIKTDEEGIDLSPHVFTHTCLTRRSMIYIPQNISSPSEPLILSEILSILVLPPFMFGFLLQHGDSKCVQSHTLRPYFSQQTRSFHTWDKQRLSAVMLAFLPAHKLGPLTTSTDNRSSSLHFISDSILYHLSNKPITNTSIWLSI